MKPPSQPSDVFADGRIVFTIAEGLLQVWSVSLEVFVRRDLGARYPGWAGAAVFLFVPAYICLWPSQNPEPLLWFLVMYIAVGLVHRLSYLKRRREKRLHGHSHYNGFPLVCAWQSNLSESTAKRYVEPLGFALFGLILLGTTPSFGWYLIGGASCLMTKQVLYEILQSQRVLDLQDSLSDQETLVDRFRDQS